MIEHIGDVWSLLDALVLVNVRLHVDYFNVFFNLSSM